MRQEINFYQGSFQEAVPLFSAAVFLQAMAAVTVVMLLCYGYAWQRVEGLQVEMEIVANQESAALERLEKLQPVIKSVAGKQGLTAQLEDALRTLDEKRIVLTLVKGTTLGDTQGFSRHMRSLAAQRIDGMWFTHIRLSGTGETTSLRGHARRPELVPTYVQNLARERPFAAQRFQQFEINRQAEVAGDVVEFSMNSEPFASSELAVGR